MQLRSQELRIETTSKCNAHCVICPREKMTREMATMPMGHFKYLVNQAQYGPFVMSTVAEIEQAIADYQAGRLVVAG